MPQPTVASTPAPSADNPVPAILHGFGHAFVSMLHQSPWVMAILALLVITALTRSARIAIHSGPRDPVRRFSRADKQLLLARAGDRCERHQLIGGRCREVARLEADHVHPHSRGGWTHISNGQILCRAHNREKLAAIPWDRSLRRLAERRADYYPVHVDRTVTRRAPVESRRRTRDPVR